MGVARMVLTFFSMTHSLVRMRHLTLCLFFILTSGCASIDPFVSFKPLFSGLDESGMTAAARSALAEARFDFECARKDHPPHYARLISHDPKAGFKCYRGRGYTLTTYADGPRHRVGQKIEVEPAITGSSTYRYDESHEPWD